MVHLTDDEKRMLQGRRKNPWVCMYLVEMCEVAGAERLVDLTGGRYAHAGERAVSILFVYARRFKGARRNRAFKIPRSPTNLLPEEARFTLGALHRLL